MKARFISAFCMLTVLFAALAPLAEADRRGVAERRHDPDREAALVHEVQRVCGILAVEDHLVAREAPPARDRDEQAHGLFGDPGHEPPPHARTMSRG